MSSLQQRICRFLLLLSVHKVPPERLVSPLRTCSTPLPTGSRCVRIASFDITIAPRGATLTFVTEGGFNCPIGEEVVVSCEVTPNSGILSNKTSGTAKLGAFGQQFTTHGATDTLNNLTCEVSAFGVQLVSDGGSAGKERSTTTP